MDYILQTKDITKRFGNIQAVDNLSLCVEKGQVFGFLGPNGSGKTTTLSIILGVTKPDNGEFYWTNNPCNYLINKQIGALLEIPNFYPYLSAIDNLKICAQIKDIESINDNEFNRVLQITGLIDRKYSLFRTYSLGMKQRLAIASALLGDPEILVLDEPANGLDPQGIADIREIIKSEASKGKTIIMASHILDEVEKICTHVGILKKGKLISSGKINELTHSDDLIVISCDNLQQCYNILKNSGLCKSIEMDGNNIFITLYTTHEPKHINEFAFKNGILLSRFDIQKRSLESQFLEIVKK